jgi:hypothetical protein
MSEQINIENVIRNTRKYWYIDGLAEIAGGLIIFLAGMTYWFVSTLENTAGKMVLLTIAQPVVIILGSYLSQKYLPRIKERLTYPRTGYLTFRKPSRNRRIKRILIVGLIAAGIGALVSMLIVTSKVPNQFLPLFSSIFLALFSIYIGYHTAVSRFYLIGFLMVLLGLVISLFNQEGILPYTLFFSGVGVIWIFSGVITLINYLRKTSPQVE